MSRKHSCCTSARIARIISRRRYAKRSATVSQRRAMTESQFQAKLLKALRQHAALKYAVIWKTSDRFTRGIPDVLISLNGVCTWLELKVWPNAPTKIQAYFIKRLVRAHVVTLLKNGTIIFDYRFSEMYDFDLAVREIVRRCAT
jgi:hypothetical protein